MKGTCHSYQILIADNRK